MSNIIWANDGGEEIVDMDEQNSIEDSTTITDNVASPDEDTEDDDENLEEVEDTDNED
jgi:hypothetical protein